MLKSKYQELVPLLRTELNLGSVMAVPKITKVVINVGAGNALSDPNLLEFVAGELANITGQAPVITKARKSVAGFKLREGNKIGVKLTLRGQRMYDFLEKLILVALPRVRDFRGLSRKGFDGSGNYTLGLREHIVFPEVVFENVDKVFGLEITIVTSAKDDETGFTLLSKLGFPFKKDKDNKSKPIV
ncbi:50S ribosomal protein L5 [candidate division Kazan bacterium]|uniref:Large ribosomal subunit protein uL5 n=1 Tax=candidate division Kazan bacterium TaxID=2202143 RepID=A0A420ZDY5_UNCK3|nr:MAG: 50S ribosomal protein L5 [candidate division Kazan bacterium]